MGGKVLVPLHHNGDNRHRMEKWSAVKKIKYILQYCRTFKEIMYVDKRIIF